MGSFLPSTDAGLLAWSLNFKTLVVATPTAFGLTTTQATAYGALHDAYATALVASGDPSTRTSPAVATKNCEEQPQGVARGCSRSWCRLRPW